MNYDPETVWARYRQAMERAAGGSSQKLEEFNDLFLARMCRVCPWPIFCDALDFVEKVMRAKAKASAESKPKFEEVVG